jgi:predicted ArsR family transcriptional regulator
MSQTYRVRGIDLDHDGKHYPEGARIMLDDKTASGLMRFLELMGDEETVAEKAAAAEKTAQAAKEAAIEKAAAEIAEDAAKLAEVTTKKGAVKGAKP